MLPDAVAALIAPRFWARVTRGDGCWTWTGTRGPKGYGRAYVPDPRPGVGGRPASAHRVAWQLANGPIPAGVCVLHRCDNPPCCRPDHLFLGTNDDNIADRHAKGRDAQNKGERGGRARLTAKDVLDMREAVRRGATRASLARAYGVAAQTVDDAVCGRSWSHLDGAIARASYAR
jgi:hypothetical protein